MSIAYLAIYRLTHSIARRSTRPLTSRQRCRARIDYVPRASKNAAPQAFIALLRSGMEDRKISLNQLAEKAGVSPAFLSRILNRERGLPSDKAILRLAQVLNLEPPESALIAAGRIPEELRPMLAKPQIPLLLRATGKLSDTDLQAVLRTAQSLALRHRKRRRT